MITTAETFGVVPNESPGKKSRVVIRPHMVFVSYFLLHIDLAIRNGKSLLGRLGLLAPLALLLGSPRVYFDRCGCSGRFVAIIKVALAYD